MTAYLVSTSADRRGPIVTYVAVFDTEEQARAAVKAKLPANWGVETITGISRATLADQQRFKPGTVERL